MKLKKIVFFTNWILIVVGFVLYFISNNIYFLLPIVIGLLIVSFCEYISLKKSDAINYQSLRVIFVYIIGAMFSLFVFVWKLLNLGRFS